MNIKKEIIEFIDSEENNGAFLLTGKWGCGKSYIIKDIVNELNEGEKYAIAMISLFGINDVSQLNSIIKEKYLEYKLGKNFTKIYKRAQQITNDGMSIASSAAPKNTTISAVTTGVKIASSYDLFSFYTVKKNLNKKKNNKKFVLVFDDFERCMITKTKLMGVINEYSENRDIKVIIIADEEKIKNKKYHEFKEKLVSRTIKITPEHNEIIHSIINNYKSSNENYKDFLAENETVLLSAFEHSGYNNFRSFKSCLMDFERVYLAWDNSNITKDDIENVLYKFCAATYEYKKGIYKVAKFYQSKIYGLITNEENKKQIKEKYLTNTFEYFFNSLSAWIVDGDWDIEAFIDEIKNRYIIDEPTSDFRFLNISFWDFEQRDIEKGLPIVLEKAYEGNLSRDELIVALQKIHALHYNNIPLPCEIDYNKIAAGFETRKERIKNGTIIEPTRHYEATVSNLDEKAQPIYENIEKCDTLFFAWENRREFINAIQNGDFAIAYTFKNRFLDCFDDELLKIFEDAYQEASNSIKRELANTITDFSFKNDSIEILNENYKVTIANYKKLIEFLNNYSNDTDDYILKIINQSFINKINEKIDEIKSLIKD